MAWFKFGKNKKDKSPQSDPEDRRPAEEGREASEPEAGETPPDEPAPSDGQEPDRPADASPDDRPEAAAETGPEKPAADNNKKGLFGRFRERLAKTRASLSGRLDALFSGGGKVDEDLLEEMEEILITSDLGVEATTELLKKLRKQIKRRNLTDPADLKGALGDSLLELLDVGPAPPAPPAEGPEVILVVGVNGVGKTTTIGKLARRFILEGKKVLLAAGDTFRAAAGEQLEIWAERVGADIVRHQAGADPSAVVFDALEAAQARGVDVVLVDTAGRLHTKVNLMEELKKVRRVMAKKIPEAPHQTLLVLDATTGQNALSQAKLFNEATPLTGLVLTKLDGTAKGGIVAAVAHQLQRPVLFVGLGEQMDDLKPFDPNAFVEAIL